MKKTRNPNKIRCPYGWKSPSLCYLYFSRFLSGSFSPYRYILTFIYSRKLSFIKSNKKILRKKFLRIFYASVGLIFFPPIPTGKLRLFGFDYIISSFLNVAFSFLFNLASQVSRTYIFSAKSNRQTTPFGFDYKN